MAKFIPKPIPFDAWQWNPKTVEEGERLLREHNMPECWKVRKRSTDYTRQLLRDNDWLKQSSWIEIFHDYNTNVNNCCNLAGTMWLDKDQSKAYRVGIWLGFDKNEGEYFAYDEEEMFGKFERVDNG